MLSGWRRARRPIRLASLGAALLAFVIVATGLIATVSARPALGAQSALTVLGGSVSVSTGGGTFVVAADGQLLEAGVTIRTGPASHAVLTYVDGSTVTIEPNSELAIERLELASTGDLVAVVRQTIGRTWHVVRHRLGPEGRYDVRTPAAVATVRGTAFTVEVDESGGMRLTTTEGVVAAANERGTVEVRAGQWTSVAVGGPPAPARTAPAPRAVLRITLDHFRNAVAVDPSGRSVGVRNGIPVRYAPGSTVEVVDGRLVLTIPADEPGRISTVVERDEPSQEAVVIETELSSGGSVVSRISERRAMDEGGTAWGGVVVTSTDVIVLTDSEAQLAGAPLIGDAPAAPAALLFASVPRATPLPKAQPAGDRTGGFSVPRASAIPGAAAPTGVGTSTVSGQGPPAAGGFVPSLPITTPRGIGAPAVAAESPRAAVATPAAAPSLPAERSVLPVAPSPAPAPTASPTPRPTTASTPAPTPAATPTASPLLSVPPLLTSPSASPSSSPSSSPTRSPSPSPTPSPTPTPTPTPCPGVVVAGICL